MQLLHNKVVFVTGGGRGLGAAICRVLAREGAAVGVNYSCSKDKAEAVVAEIVASGGRAVALQADVRNGEEAKRAIDQLAGHFERLDGVVNNAIGGLQNGKFADVTPENYQMAFDFGCAFFLSPLATYVTGNYLTVNGGRTTQMGG